MESTFSFVIGLLTAALSLLGLVEKHPELPQESREQAQQVAEQAITQATQALNDSALTQKAYISNELGFSITYPGHLVISSESIKNIGVSFGSLLLGKNPENIKDILPVFSVDALYGVSPQDVEQRMMKALGHDVEVLSHTTQEILVNNRSATKHSFSYQDYGGVRNTEFVWIPRDSSQGYLIKNYAGGNMFEKILQTFAFVDFARNPENDPVQIVSIGTLSSNGTKEKPLGASVGWMSQFPITINKKNATLQIDWGDGATETVHYDAANDSTRFLKHTYLSAGERIVKITVSSGGKTTVESFFMHVR